MPARRFASLRTLKRIQGADQFRTADVVRMTYLGPYGPNHLLVRPLGCASGDLLAANASPGRAPEPGSQINVARPQGGSGLFAFPAVALSGGGSTRVAKQEAVAPPPPASGAPLIALRMTDFSGGNITFDIASFSGATHVETLYTGVVVPGFPPSAPQATAGAARAQLMDARSLVGLSGLPDGSIGLKTSDVSLSPDEATMNVISIETGAVTSRLYVPGFTPILGGEQFPGWDYFGDKIYFTAAYELRTRLQISTFPPDLSSQTIIADENLSMTQRSVAFYAADAILGKDSKVDTWARVPYSTGQTDPFVSGSSPGNRLGGHPQSLGLAGGLYWHVGRADISSIPVAADRDIKLYTTIDIADVGANGFTDVGLAAGGAFYQTWNGSRRGQYDFNRDRTAIIGFPIWTSPGPAPSPDGTPGVVSIPLTATDWSEASFVQMSTTPFRPDSVIADGRDA